jgi:NitT/TauT family transport system ATP-binding protein
MTIAAATATPTSESNMPFATACGVTHYYGNLKVVDDVTFELKRGESVAIVSPSGSGKSTMLRLLLGLEKPTEGNTSMFLSPKQVGAVFQDDSLFPWLTVAENVSILNRLHRQPINAKRLSELSASYDLSEFSQYYPSQLSAGMKQKVALCRLLLYDPCFYVLDEAMANMDDLVRFVFCDALRGRITQRNSAILFVTHSITDAIHLADRVLIGSARPLHLVREFVNPLKREHDFTIRFTREFQDVVEMLQQWIGRP